MKKEYKYNGAEAKKRYDLLVDDMLYNIIINLRENGLSFEDMAEEFGITLEELMQSLVNNPKDYFVCLEGIHFLENKKIYTNHSKLIELNKIDEKNPIRKKQM